jgi:ABC-2 type transport system ATP-binding protein
MADLAIETEGLTKRFGSFTAVDAIDLEVAAGTVVALLGPNGAGKTTTVRMLATLSQPTAGRARVCGYDVVHQADAVRGVLSLTGQFAALDDNLTAEENLLLMARLRGYGRRAAKGVVEQLIEGFAISEFRGSLIKAVSGGQRRRVDLAASLVVRPQLLVLDEPTTGLDPRSRQTVWTTVRQLVAEGVTLLLTTQYLEEADALAERIVLIDHGRSVAEGTPGQLKAQIGDQRVDVVTTQAGDLDRLAAALRERYEQVTVQAERRTVSVQAPEESDDLMAVAAVVRHHGVAVDEVALRRPTLDDAFLTLTGQPAAGAGDSSGGSHGTGTDADDQTSNDHETTEVHA